MRFEFSPKYVKGEFFSPSPFHVHCSLEREWEWERVSWAYKLCLSASARKCTFSTIIKTWPLSRAWIVCTAGPHLAHSNLNYLHQNQIRTDSQPAVTLSAKVRTAVHRINRKNQTCKINKIKQQGLWFPWFRFSSWHSMKYWICNSVLHGKLTA